MEVHRRRKITYPVEQEIRYKIREQLDKLWPYETCSIVPTVSKQTLTPIHKSCYIEVTQELKRFLRREFYEK